MTLEELKKAILFKNQKLQDTPMPKVVERINAYFDLCLTSAIVEEEAILFYLLNGAFGRLCAIFDKKEQLPPEAEKLALMYLNTASKSTARLFYYMFLTTTREARHLHGSDSFRTKLKAKFGEGMNNFIIALNGKGSDSTVNYVKKCPSTLNDITLGTYTTAITYAFNEGDFSGGYGGKPWGNIADTLRKAVFGETSLEIMNDTAWTLAHNNGPMFNKGIFYNCYTHDIYKVLDVQRSGQMAEFVTENGNSGFTGMTSAVKEALELCKPFFPEDFLGYVDWYKVEALGSMKKYPTEKAAQKLAHGKNGDKKTYANTPNGEVLIEGETFFVNENEFAVILKKRAA